MIFIGFVFITAIVGSIRACVADVMQLFLGDIWTLTASSFVTDENQEERFVNMTAEQIREYEVEVMRKIADLALIPPKLNTSPLPKYDYDNLDYGMNRSIERTPGGRLWVA